MIEEVIKSVKIAESKAEEIVSAAEEKAAESKLDADKVCAEIIEKAKREARAQSAVTVFKAEKEAEEAFATAAKRCEKDCEKLRKDKSGKVEELAQEVFGRIVG